MRKAMHADPENYVTSMAPGQYWTWGTHMRGLKGERSRHTCRLVRVAAVLILLQQYVGILNEIKLCLCVFADYKMSPSASGVTSRPWTPRCTPPPPQQQQQQQPSVPSHPHPHPPPDYHHNVYIPGTPSGFCTLRPAAQRSELDVHNSFSTFGKKRRLQMSPQGEAAIINNDLYND